MSELVVRTSASHWLTELAKAYKRKSSVTLIDDARLGVDPLNQTLLQMGRKANLGIQEWIAVLVGLGMGAMGAYLLVMAILDPEPFSKLGFTLAAGSVLTMGGGFAAMRVLTGHKPPKVTLSSSGEFVIEFQ